MTLLSSHPDVAEASSSRCVQSRSAHQHTPSPTGRGHQPDAGDYNIWGEEAHATSSYGLRHILLLFFTADGAGTEADCGEEHPAGVWNGHTLAPRRRSVEASLLSNLHTLMGTAIVLLSDFGFSSSRLEDSTGEDPRWMLLIVKRCGRLSNNFKRLTGDWLNKRSRWKWGVCFSVRLNFFILKIITVRRWRWRWCIFVLYLNGNVEGFIAGSSSLWSSRCCSWKNVQMLNFTFFLMSVGKLLSRRFPLLSGSGSTKLLTSSYPGLPDQVLVCRLLPVALTHEPFL